MGAWEEGSEEAWAAVWEEEWEVGLVEPWAKKVKKDVK